MKRLIFLFILTLIVQQGIWAQCNAGSYTVTTYVTINHSCTITGDLTIVNGGILNVDFTGAGADTFVVRGNILLQGNAVLWVHTDSGVTGKLFIVSNSYNGQRTITAKDSSRVQLEYVEFRTQEGNLANAASIYMNYNAEGSSIFYINRTWLDTQKAWLLCNLFNKSTLVGFDPNSVPTEIYLQDTAQLVLHGPDTHTGIWLIFESITDTLNLPPDQSQPYTWNIGRGFGDLTTTWYFEADTALPGLGVQILPDAKMVINGIGSAAKEVTVALLFANGTDTLKNLTVGIQNTTVANGVNGHVTLNNVNLGPIAWQLYAFMNENLYIKKSVVNEIGIAGPSHVVVDSSLLQLAVLAAVGVGGSSMTVNNSDIWNQSITAFNNSTVTLNNCNVTGSAFSTTDTSSRITVNGGCFFQNPAGCTGNTALNMTTGQPYCNPFIPPGFPKILTPATITLIGVDSNCVTGINEAVSVNSFQIYPNPVSTTLNISIPGNQQSQLDIFNAMGMLIKEIAISRSSQIDIAGLTDGLYFIHLKNGSGQTQKFLKQ